MDAFEYLTRYTKHKRQAQKIADKIEEIQDAIGGRNIESHDYIASTNKIGSRTENAALELSELHSMLQNEQREVIAALCESIIAIEKLSDADEKYILSLRYIDNMSYADIADLMQQSERTIYRIHRRAIKNLNELLPAEDDEQCYQ